MNPLSRKRPLRFGDFIARASDVFSRTNREDHGGADADPIPLIPGHDCDPDVPLRAPGHRNQSCRSKEATS